LGWSDEGRLRFPVFREIREDVGPKECRAAPGDDREERVFEEALEIRAQERPSVPPGVLTNPDKVFWPEERYTKRDLVEYYVAVADALLPLLRGRPTLLVRYPDGIEGKRFFQWNPPRGARAHVRTMRFRDSERAHKRAFLVDDVSALAYVINLGCIPLHVLCHREKSPEYCDFLIVDFDVGERPLADAVRLAHTLKGILDEIGLSGFPKTSGQTGLHVLVALGPSVTFDSAKILAEILARLIVDRHPDLATMQRTVSKRGGRVYVDTGQTGRSRAIVAPYCVRAWPGATVSTPLAWTELSRALDPRQFTLRTVPQRLAERGDLMRGLLETQPDFSAAMGKLEGLLRKSPG
jgi:bifunctional non-homologous end joining protein LigD